MGNKSQYIWLVSWKQCFVVLGHKLGSIERKCIPRNNNNYAIFKIENFWKIIRFIYGHMRLNRSYFQLFSWCFQIPPSHILDQPFKKSNIHDKHTSLYNKNAPKLQKNYLSGINMNISCLGWKPETKMWTCFMFWKALRRIILHTLLNPIVFLYHVSGALAGRNL